MRFKKIKEDIFKKHGKKAENTGSTEGQIALFTFRINHLTEHLKKNKKALDAFKTCCRTEGIIPALEPSHALAYVEKIAGSMDRGQIIVMNMCGRGDKDVFTVADALGTKL